MPWPAFIAFARWAAVTAVGYFGYETVKEVSAVIVAPPPPPPAPEMDVHPVTGSETTAKQSRFVRVAIMVGLGLLTLRAVERLKRTR
jgi:hypothetical protein